MKSVQSLGTAALQAFRAMTTLTEVSRTSLHPSEFVFMPDHLMATPTCTARSHTAGFSLIANNATFHKLTIKIGNSDAESQQIQMSASQCHGKE